MKRNYFPLTPIVLVIVNIMLLILTLGITLNQDRFHLSGVIKTWALFGFFFVLTIGLLIENWGIIYASTMACDGMIIIFMWPHYTIASVILIIMAITVITMTPLIYKEYINAVKKGQLISRTRK